MSARQDDLQRPVGRRARSGRGLLEVDELFRPTEPKFSSTTVRGVVGILPRVEGGVDFGGLNAPGPVIPTATVAIEVQPVRAGGFALTAGGNGLFFLKGSEDGDPAGFGYGFASYRIPKLGTRIEFGGWYSSAGYALPRSTGSALGDVRAAGSLRPGTDGRRRLVQRRELDRIRQPRPHLRVRALDRVRRLLLDKEERQFAGQRRADRARLPLLRTAF